MISFPLVETSRNLPFLIIVTSNAPVLLDLVPSLYAPSTFPFLISCSHSKSCMIFQTSLDLIDQKVYQIVDPDVSILTVRAHVNK